MIGKVRRHVTLAVMLAACGGRSAKTEPVTSQPPGAAGAGGSVSGVAGGTGHAGAAVPRGGSAGGGMSGGGGAGTTAVGGSMQAGQAQGGAAAESGGGAFGGFGAGTVCSDPDQSLVGGPGLPSEARTRSTATGPNGDFTDYCDEAGNLVEYHCTGCPGCQVQLCTPPPCTGPVIPTNIDCQGRCSDGACSYWCVGYREELIVLEVADDMLTVQHLNGRLACRVTYEIEGFDCRSDSLKEHVLIAVAQGQCDPSGIVVGVYDSSGGGQEIQQCMLECMPVEEPDG